jgi:hypothetical protein
MICWLDAQISEGPYRVDISVEAFVILHDSTWFIAKCQELDTILVQQHIVI